MTREEVIANLADYAGKVFKADKSKITAETNIAAELGTKSLNRLAMCSLIENNMDVVIPIGEFGNYVTIGDLADKIIEEM